MILTPQQSAVVLTVMRAGGTGTLTFKDDGGHSLVNFKDNGLVFVTRYLNDFIDGAKPETYATFDHFELAYRGHVKADFARALAHYPELARQAAERTGEEVLPEHRP